MQLQGVVDRRERPRIGEAAFQRMRSRPDRVAVGIDEPLFLSLPPRPTGRKQCAAVEHSEREDRIGERLPSLALV